jgi:hypothetical protein
MLKKLLLVVALAGFGGYFAYKKTKQSRTTGQDTWADAVDPVNPGH